MADRGAGELLDRFYLEMLGEVSYDAVVEFARAIEDRARADERERIAQEIEDYDAKVCDAQGERCTCDVAARIARGGQP